MDTDFNWAFGVHTIGANLSLYNYDLSTGKEPSRRPKESLGLRYGHVLNDQHSFGADLRYQGKRFEEQNSIEKTLDPYQVIDLSYTFTKDDLKLMGDIKN